jgi:hypothetical protein
MKRTVEQPEATDPDPVEEYTASDGARWIRVWRTVRPGLMQLVWVRAAPRALPCP